MEPYSETLGEHQFPIHPISSWQEWNDLSLADWWAAKDEEDFRWTDSEERIEREFRDRRDLPNHFDYSCQ